MKRLMLIAMIVLSGALFAQEPFRFTNEIRIDLVSVSLTKNGPSYDERIYRPGQTVWINLSIGGLVKNSAQDVVFQSDLYLFNSHNEIVLDQKNILNMKLAAAGIPNPVVTANYNIDLYQNIKADWYTVDIVVRDLVSMKMNKYTACFRVIR